MASKPVKVRLVRPDGERERAEAMRLDPRDDKQLRAVLEEQIRKHTWHDEREIHRYGLLVLDGDWGDEITTYRTS